MPTVLSAKKIDQLRHDWSKEEIAAIYNQPLLELVLMQPPSTKNIEIIGYGYYCQSYLAPICTSIPLHP